MGIIVGLDGVLALNAWRHELIASEGWEAYHIAAARDAPNQPIIQAVNAIHNMGQHVWCVSNRPDKWRQLTLGWLVRHGSMVDTLLMRPEGNWQKDDELREAMLSQIVSVSGDVSFVIDENEKACDFWRAAGIPTMQLTNPSNT